MKNVKKVIGLSLAVLMILGSATATYASARYVCIREFLFSGSVTSTSVVGEANVGLSGAYDSETVITLERSSGGEFQDYLILTKKSSTRSSYTASASKSGLSSAYDYRLRAELFVYDDNGNQIDYDCSYID